MFRKRVDQEKGASMRLQGKLKVRDEERGKSKKETEEELREVYI